MGVLLPWMLAIGFQTARDVRVCNRPPVPSEFVASGAIFGVLAVVSQGAPELATVLAWGLLIALALQAGGPQGLGGKVPKLTPAQVRSRGRAGTTVTGGQT